jgi:hypothetical protein
MRTLWSFLCESQWQFIVDGFASFCFDIEANVRRRL